MTYVYKSNAAHDSSNYRLLANPHRHYYTTRNKPILMGVIHITAGINDYDGLDNSAEATVAYSAKTDVVASYHGIVDSDSIIDCLPDEYTAFAQGVPGYNFNSPALSLEIGKASTDWNATPDDWTGKVLRNAAEWWAPRVIRYNIPITLVTDRDRIQNLINQNKPVGFTEHWMLSPDTRNDAGRVGNETTFPWDRFFFLLRREVARLKGGNLTVDGKFGPNTIRALEKWIGIKQTGKWTTYDVKALQRKLNSGRFIKLTVNGKMNRWTVKRLQKKIGATPDGKFGPETVKVLQRFLNRVS